MGDNITVNDILVKNIRTLDGVSRSEAEAVAKEIMNDIQKKMIELGEKGSGELKFGSMFKVEGTKVNSRKGRNPTTGEELTIPAKTTIKLKLLGAFRKKASKEI